MYVSRRLSSGGADGMSCPTVPDGGTAAGEGTAIGADATAPDSGTAAGEGTAIGADDIGAEACSRLLLSIAHGHGQLASVAPHSIDERTRERGDLAFAAAPSWSLGRRPILK